LSPAHKPVLLETRDTVEIEDELGEQALVVLLPLSDGVEVVLGPLHLPWWYFILACSFKLPRQGRSWGPTTTHKTVTARLVVLDFDDVLLGRRLAKGAIALLTRA
jgi:hypothetical protein